MCLTHGIYLSAYVQFKTSKWTIVSMGPLAIGGHWRARVRVGWAKQIPGQLSRDQLSWGPAHDSSLQSQPDLRFEPGSGNKVNDLFDLCDSAVAKRNIYIESNWNRDANLCYHKNSKMNIKLHLCECIFRYNEHLYNYNYRVFLSTVTNKLSVTECTCLKSLEVTSRKKGFSGMALFDPFSGGWIFEKKHYLVQQRC